MTSSKENTDDKHNDKKTRNKVIIAIIIFIIIACLIFSIYMLIQMNNGKAQINNLEENIKTNNAQRLAEQLSSNDRKMSTNEAKHLISYLHEDSHYKKFQKQINQVKDNVEHDNDHSDLGVITDEDGEEIITFSKNGKKFFFLDKVSMKAHYRNVYVKELDNPAIYHIGKHNNAPTKANDINKIGSFVVGDYDVPVTKEFKENPVKGKTKGKIHINTNKKDDKHRVIAKQDFTQTKIKIKVHNDEDINNKSLKLYINGHLMKFNKDKIYGYYPNKDNFDVHVTGKYKDRIFKTNKVSVMESLSNSVQIVNLDFDKNQIKKIMKKEGKNKKQIDKFIKDYMNDLNKAYKETDYQPIEKYIDTNTQAENYMKPKFKEKQHIKYTDTKVNSIKEKNDEYLVEVQKKFESNVVKTDYYIAKNGDEYKIKKIVDQT